MSRGGFSVEGDIFCVACVVFGALFVLNLMIAVQFNFLDEAFNEIEMQKQKEKEKHEEEMRENRKNVEEIERDNELELQNQARSQIDLPPQ